MSWSRAVVVSAIYNKCIFKFDHYCAWTNNCVGGLNFRYFLLFLLSLCAMVLNGLILHSKALLNIVEMYQLWTLRYMGADGQPQPMDFTTLTQARISYLNTVVSK